MLIDVDEARLSLLKEFFADLFEAIKDQDRFLVQPRFGVGFVDPRDELVACVEHNPPPR